MYVWFFLVNYLTVHLLTGLLYLFFPLPQEITKGPSAMDCHSFMEVMYQSISKCPPRNPPPGICIQALANIKGLFLNLWRVDWKTKAKLPIRLTFVSISRLNIIGRLGECGPEEDCWQRGLTWQTFWPPDGKSWSELKWFVKLRFGTTA